MPKPPGEVKISLEEANQVFAFPLVSPSLQNAILQVGDTKKLVMIASPPKSGSTWIANTVQRHLGVYSGRFTYAWSSNEHDLYPPGLLAYAKTGAVSQLHIKATPHNIQLIKDFGIETIVLTRNIFDGVVSFARDLRAKLALEVQSPGIAGYSFVWLTPTMRDWTDEQLLHYAVDHYLPWYMNFLRSWDDATDVIAQTRVRYESLMNHPAGEIGQLLVRLGHSGKVDPEIINTRYDGPGRSNTESEAGSGRHALGDELCRRIEGFFIDADSPWVRSHLQLP